MALVISWNACGLPGAHAQLLSLAATTRPLAICIQETKLQPKAAAAFPLPGYAHWDSFNGGGKAVHGSRIYVRDSVACAPLAAGFTPELAGHVVAVALGEGEARVTLVGTYVPNSGTTDASRTRRAAFDAAYSRFVAALPGPLLLVGDFNCCLNSTDYHGNAGKLPGLLSAEKAALGALLVTAGLVDVFPALLPSLPPPAHYTFWSVRYGRRETNKARNLGWRLDYMFAPPGLMARLASPVVMARGDVSDHAPIGVLLSLAPSPAADAQF